MREGNWIQGAENIAATACDHFQSIFPGEEKAINEDILNCIPRLINDDQNPSLQYVPTMEELKEVACSMNPNSAAGRDGMNGKFFQSCWTIICNDLLKVVHYFFCGHMIPKFFSHACSVLLPKVNHPNKLTEFRPISLSNFTNKIISKLSLL